MKGDGIIYMRQLRQYDDSKMGLRSLFEASGHTTRVKINTLRELAPCALTPVIVCYVRGDGGLNAQRIRTN